MKREKDPDQLRLHGAPWVVTVATGSDITCKKGKRSNQPNLIEHGGVLTKNGCIIAVGRFKDLKKEYPSSVVTFYEDCIFTPALVNAHSHLELAYLAELGREKQFSLGLPSWIRILLSKKKNSIDGEKEIINAARQSLDLMFQSGIGLVGDIANMPESCRIADYSPVQVFSFLELMGISVKSEKEALDHLNLDTELGMICTVHAPYSASPRLIREVKQHTLKRQNIFSIHVAESQEELDFLRFGRGEFRELLTERGWWDGSFSPTGDDLTGSISYLDRLGVLDEKTLCVHVVNLTLSEISLIAKRKSRVCLCPGSNRQLGVGKAPADEFVSNGILPALGTDSLASNPNFDLWTEMKILREDHPNLDPEIIFAMASRGGAEALGYDQKMGSLTPGRRALFLAVQNQTGTAKDIFEFLTSTGKSVKFSWID